jgi:death-on-curing protein
MLHSQLVNQTRGCDGVRDYNLLESAIETPFQEFAGEELYPTIQQKAARLGYGLIKNHCMLDGNKRIGVHAMLVFLELNGITLKYTQKQLYEMILAVADGSLEYEGMLKWVLEHQE